MAKKFRITAPDGKTLEITGPDDATPEQAMQQAQQMYKPDQVDLNHLFSSPTPSAPVVQSDDRTAGQVAIDQAINVGKGAVGAVTGIPDMLRKAAGIGYDALTGNASGAASGAKDVASGIVHGVVDPIATTARGVGAYVAPNKVAPPSRQDWETSAQDAGGMAGSIALGEAVRSIPTSAEGIQGVAAKLRSVRAAQRSVGVPLTGTQAAGAAIRAGVGPVTDAAASIAERLAKVRAGMDTAPTVNTPTAAPPSNPVESTPEMQSMNTPVQYNTPTAAPPANPIEPTPEMQSMNTPVQYNTPTAAPPANPIEPTPEMQNMNTPVDYNVQPTPAAAPPTATIEPTAEMMTQMVAHPDAGTATPRDIQMAREAILQNGAARSTGNLMKVSRNVPELLKTVPELKGVPAGPNFNAKLFGAFNRIGHELNATEASIPDSTMVPTEDAVKQLKDLEAKYLDTNQPAAVRAIDKVKSFLADRPSMSWDDFIKAKRAFFSEIKLSSGAGREAYQIFKKLSNDVSPELGKLNQQYYTVKSAMENAAMDIKNGEKIRTIGKPEKPPVQPDSGRSFILPL